MNKKFIYVCSPCRGDYEKNIQWARDCCRGIMETYPDVVPIAPHIYFTQFLDDKEPTERLLGMDAGLALLDMCDEIWVYGLKDPSEGMKIEIEYAKEHQITIRDGFDRLFDMKDAMEKLAKEPGDVELSLYTGEEKPDEPLMVTLAGAAVVEMAKVLRRHRGTDFALEMEAES